MSKIISVGFDGTIVSDNYPNITQPNPQAISILLKLVEQGHLIVLDTYRTGELLQAAVDYLNNYNIPIYANASNYPINLQINNLSINCPRNYNKDTNSYWVNWVDVNYILKRTGYLI